MYINGEELAKLEIILAMLDDALERNPKNFEAGYHNIKDSIKDAYDAINKITEREIVKRAKKIIKNKDNQ